MFFRILRNDLKRKKVMTIVLLLFIIISSMLVASSVSQMVFITNATENLISKGKVADYTIWIHRSDKWDRMVESWAKKQKELKSYARSTELNITKENVAFSSKRKKLSEDIMLMLMKTSTDSNLVFSEKDKTIKLRKGEVAIPIFIKDSMGIKLGNKIVVNVNGMKKTMKVKAFVKDTLLGSPMTTVKRFVLSSEDFNAFAKVGTKKELVRNWRFVLRDGYKNVNIAGRYLKSGLPSMGIELGKATAKLSYEAYFGILVVLLFAVSLLMIMIAFLTLRFTINSSIQEDYKEIGVLKAIGLNNYQIRKLYLIKYLFLAVFGGTAGLVLSLPLTKVVSGSMKDCFIVGALQTHIGSAVLSIITVVLIILIFCYLCMRKINRFSVMDAIRQGNIGERFGKSRRIYLFKKKLMGDTLFLALSDIINRFKSFCSLAIVFTLCVFIIVIPINLKNTVKDSKFLSYFGITTGDVYIDGLKRNIDIKTSEADNEKIIKRLNERIGKVKLYPEYLCLVRHNSKNEGSSGQIIGIKSALPSSKYEYTRGTAPVLENEIAITEVMAKRYDKSIGDYIELLFDGRKRNFIITGTFDTMMGSGMAVKLPDNFKVKSTLYCRLIGFINTDDNAKRKIIKRIKLEFPNLKVMDDREELDSFAGGITNQLNSLVAILIAIVCLVLFFITSLFVGMMITKDISNIAIMKSLGFTEHKIKIYQSLKIFIILVCSTIIGTLFANILGEKLIGLIFRMFGLSKVTFSIVPLQVFLMCPLIILFIVTTSVFISCKSIKNIHVWNISEE